MKQISTTTIVAIYILTIASGMLTIVLLGLAKCSAETQSQIIQICYAIIMLILGYFYGASHGKKELTETTEPNIKQTTITNE